MRKFGSQNNCSCKCGSILRGKKLHMPGWGLTCSWRGCHFTHLLKLGSFNCKFPGCSNFWVIHERPVTLKQQICKIQKKNWTNSTDALLINVREVYNFMLFENDKWINKNVRNGKQKLKAINTPAIFDWQKYRLFLPLRVLLL